MPAELNRRLTTQDASFLYLEKPNEPMHIGSCAVYEGDISADTLTDLLRRRLHRLPRYRQRVVFAPLAVAHPTWEDDPDFDIRNHIEEIELSATTDRAELGLAAAAACTG